MKKILIICFTFIVLCSCSNHTNISVDFSESSLLFDMGATSIDDIAYCKIIDDGVVPEILINEEDYILFSEYRYKSDYPMDKLHELMVFPKNKLIQISISNKEFSLYIMEDGNIGVRISEEDGYKLYQADENSKITPQKYDKLIKKYSK